MVKKICNILISLLILFPQITYAEGFLGISFQIPKEITESVSAKKETNEAKTYNNTSGALNAFNGVYYGPSGKETYYNLDMSGIISIMTQFGYTWDDYAVREDGVKTLGGRVMVAADLSKYPRGSFVETSLGEGIVCDTGGFVHNGSGVVFDIATAW